MTKTPSFYMALIAVLTLFSCAPSDQQERTKTVIESKKTTNQPVSMGNTSPPTQEGLLEGRSPKEIKGLIAKALEEVPEARPYVDMKTGEFEIINARAEAGNDLEKILAVIDMLNQYEIAFSRVSISLNLRKATKSLGN